jgi:hypothetical protein
LTYPIWLQPPNPREISSSLALELRNSTYYWNTSFKTARVCIQLYVYMYIYIGYINTHTIIYTLWHSSALYLFLGWVPRMHCTLTLGYARSPMPGFLGNAVGGYRQYLLNRNMTNHYTRNYKWLDAADNVVNLCKFTCSVSFICNVLLLKNGNKS